MGEHVQQVVNEASTLHRGGEGCGGDNGWFAGDSQEAWGFVIHLVLVNSAFKKNHFQQIDQSWIDIRQIDQHIYKFNSMAQSV